jgi:carboxyl-terminal processing protease
MFLFPMLPIHPYLMMVPDISNLLVLPRIQAKKLKDASFKLKESGKLTGLILDLRDNGGGLLNEAVTITNLFVKKGEMVVSTKGKTPDRNKSYKTAASTH